MNISANPVQIQLIENVLIYEAGLRCLLDNEPDFEVMQHARCDPGAYKPAHADHEPDVLLMVMDYGERSGLDCVQQITCRHPTTNLLVLCMIEDPYFASFLLELGVRGVISSHTPPEILFRAIRNVAAGETYIDTDIARAIATLNANGETSPFAALTLRELEITRLMLNGLNQKKIAERLFISPHTVANHHTHILKKLNVDNHIGLTKLAIRHNLTKA